MAANFVSSKVRHISVNENGMRIVLQDPEHIPLTSAFLLMTNNPNYNSFYSLAIIAATNGYELKIFTKNDIVPTEYAEIEKFMIVWD